MKFHLTGLICATIAIAGYAQATVITTATGTLGADAEVQEGSTTNTGFAAVVDVKNVGSDSSTFNRKGYIRFDLNSLTSAVTKASFELQLAFNDGGGSPQNVTPQDYTVRVYGLNNGSAAGGGILGGDWAENSIIWSNAPANIVSGKGAKDSVVIGNGTANGGQATLLGTFGVKAAIRTNVLALSGGVNSPLVNFLNAATSKTATFILTRATFNSQGGTPTPTAGSSNLAFATKERSGTLPPTLLINQSLAGPYVASIASDSNWRSSPTAPGPGWNTTPSYNDTGAGWQSASLVDGNTIWSSPSPSPGDGYFRNLFNLDDAAASASATFNFDDAGEAYINGQLVASGSGTVTTLIDPNLFVIGQNLIAIHGQNVSAPISSVGAEVNLVIVPEPATLSIVMLGGLVLMGRRRVKDRALPSA